MSTIAKKLCNDIVEPILKPSSTDSRTLKFSEKSVNTYQNINNNVKSRQTLQIEKKKHSKIEPSHITSPTKNKVKFSEQRIKKKLINSAINTLISGPLKCDNNCITLIHKRDHQINCKCHSLKPNLKGSTKEIQTLCKKNYFIYDKSCTHCIETVSCGTQFMDNIHGILKESFNRSNSKVAIKIQDSNEIYKLITKVTEQPFLNDGNFKFNLKKPRVLKSSSLRYGAKRWALSNFPTRGPDF